ncbi:cell number regulator 8-like [Durio zibethinus]|uniref:Cell number regulator 8-like n=1 Tax=Durio zibethinus TaxID=66656 RepID=A0A6P5Z0F2_DURZI|nr:cell number regulator 8-like [Durio zibethinus]XP_022746042.1 cell number regulator 8-like [Durio zibethinus]
MANKDGSNNDAGEESSPLLSKQVVEEDEKKKLDGKTSRETTPEVAASPEVCTGTGFGWTADGLPLDQGGVVGEPMGRSQWDSSLLACLGRNDEFCSSDIEVCLLGSMAPCVLYGSNVERLGSAPGTFASHCVPYAVLYLIGNSYFGWNTLAPSFSFPSRVAIRRKFNLEGTCEAINRSCGCCGSCMEDDVQRERCETVCDFATHFFCHACALCQEGRELRRRLPHPGFNAQPVLVMIPPEEQTMGRGA